MRDLEYQIGVCDYCKAFGLPLEELRQVRHWDVCTECLPKALKEEASREPWATTAPEVYDGFGTETDAILGEWHGQVMRLVSILGEHREWQLSRYGSGGYFHSQALPHDFAATPEEEPCQ